MNVHDLFGPGWETEKFPEELCVHQNTREPDVFDAKEWFLCVAVFDSPGRSWGSLHVCTPYTAKNLYGDGPAPLLYGWTDGINIYEHYQNGLNSSDEKVIAWKRLDGELDLFTLFPSPPT